MDTIGDSSQAGTREWLIRRTIPLVVAFTLLTLLVVVALIGQSHESRVP